MLYLDFIRSHDHWYFLFAPSPYKSDYCVLAVHLYNMPSHSWKYAHLWLCMMEEERSSLSIPDHFRSAETLLPNVALHANSPSCCSTSYQRLCKRLGLEIVCFLLIQIINVNKQSSRPMANHFHHKRWVNHSNCAFAIAIGSSWFYIGH